MVLLVKGGMSRIVYGVIGVLVVAVVVLTGLVGYLYGQGFQTATVTTTVTSQMTTVTTTTQTRIITVTNTSGNFTRFEKLEISNSYVTRNAGDYTITVSYKNAGPDDITLVDIFVGEKPLESFWSMAQVNGSTLSPISLPSGASGQILIVFPDDGGNRAFTPGQTVVVKVQTAAGVYYVGTFLIP